jgi:adenine-specific DNA-methyltransferase
VLPPRGSTAKGDARLWLVKAIHKAKKTADLDLLDATEAEPQTVAMDDLIVIAEFRDTIYPGLVSTGKVTRGGDKPWHTVINGENYHVLKALTWTHRGKVDAIYIDPPYNTGAKDWKYNNDYVEGDDLYRHSKWLAMMERRLLVAKELLNPADSVLIVTIDEKEYLRLGSLLEQTCPEARIQMVSSIVNPNGTGRPDALNRTDEYLYFVRFGTARITPQPNTNGKAKVARWDTFRRHNPVNIRSSRPNQFYPIYVNEKTRRIESVGEPITPETDRHSVPDILGCVAVFPIREDGTEMLWSTLARVARKRAEDGFLRVGKKEPDSPQVYPIMGVYSGTIKDVHEGRARVVKRREDGSADIEYSESMLVLPTTNWSYPSHNARAHGTDLVPKIVGRRFPFPKSLYAVEDALRFFVAQNLDATILDFFSGSGTTAHAVMRLNKQDGGNRQCISVTNNEVSADEQKALREQGLRPGDPEWEKLGICDYITKPRVQAAITGKTPDGEPIRGDYKFTDEFPMADGFEENAEFFTLTYETPIAVSYQTAFARIAPLLWLRAGSVGGRIEKVPAAGWEVVDSYGLLVELDKATDFLKATRKAKALRIAYIVTDDERRFQALARRLPEGVEAIRLYESYLTNFAFANGEDA